MGVLQGGCRMMEILDLCGMGILVVVWFVGWRIYCFCVGWGGDGFGMRSGQGKWDVLFLFFVVGVL